MRIYLGGPINGCTDEEANGWREEAKKAIESSHNEWVDPMSRDYRGREMEPGIAQEIVRGDLEDIAGCDVLLMNCPKPSVGTAMEVFYGHRVGKRVVVVVPDDGRAPSPWLVVHSHEIVRGSVIEAVEKIVLDKST